MVETHNPLWLLSFLGFQFWCIFVFYYILKSGSLSFFRIEFSRSERPALFYIVFVLFLLLYLILVRPWESPIFQPLEWRSLFS